tara:strand:+ start:296 stop:760 length:465 start_codon:yes stop_codon:yes gene_type:complete
MADKVAYLKKVGGGFVPVDEMNDPEIFKQIKMGDIISVQFKRPRNVKRLRKYFALLNIAFDAWEAPETSYNNIPAMKSFTRFRSDIICGAGFYDVVASINGDVRAEAKSISFAKMDETEFNELYNNTANYILLKILKNYKRDDLDQLVEQIINF